MFISYRRWRMPAAFRFLVGLEVVLNLTAGRWARIPSADNSKVELNYTPPTDLGPCGPAG